VLQQTWAEHPTLTLRGGGSQDIDDVAQFCSSGIQNPGEDAMVVVGKDLVSYARDMGLAALEEVGSGDAAMMGLSMDLSGWCIVHWGSCQWDAG